MIIIDTILSIEFFSKASSNMIEFTIYVTKFLGDIFKGIVYGFEAGTADENPPNEAQGIAEGISGVLMLYSDIIQYFALLAEPS